MTELDDNPESVHVRPGLHPHATLSHFPADERQIIERLSKEWYVTNTGSEIRLSPTSIYRYVLAKPTDVFREMFNLDREMVFLFSPYDNFEPRTLDAISEAYSRHQALRLERICSVVISRDAAIQTKLRELLKNDQEAQIVVPFTYAELSTPISDAFFFRNRFRSHFYARDLFASESPLRKDIYFFGRTDLVHSLVNRHRSHQVSGLFGLRKTGKTSVLFGVQRALQHLEGRSAFIDCQTPAFHRLRWNHALHYILAAIREQNNVTDRLGPIEQYTEEKAPVLFEKHLVRMVADLGNKSILLIFDEVENITPTASPSDHWRTGQDFVFFWQSLRSLFQRKPEVFSYLLVGTNPLCVELAKVGTADNPIFAQVPLEYIPGFDVPQTREMVRRLGRIIGLHFDEGIYARLTDDFGGHPYLVRHLCSVVNRIARSDRPVRVDKSLYEEAVKVFLRDYGQFMEMILNVLKEFFPDEYEMLRLLAQGDMQTFKEFAANSPLYTNHLLGYGILQEVDGRYAFRIETIRRFLEARERFMRLHLSDEEKWGEVSERRNRIERDLRRLCRMQLKGQLGEAVAREGFLKVIGEPRASRMAGLSYGDLFDADKAVLYFTDMAKVVGKFWDCFKNVFGPNKDEIVRHLETINSLRVDAHARTMTEAEFTAFRLSAERVENLLSGFLA